MNAYIPTVPMMPHISHSRSDNGCSHDRIAVTTSVSTVILIMTLTIVYIVLKNK